MRVLAENGESSRPMCEVCSHRYSIYTCPRCTLRTCSLTCSSSHKTASGCTGERNKAAYVPANQYGWGTMMNDYVFLEDVGRKVGGWGKEIVSSGFSQTVRGRRPHAAHGRGRGHTTSKRDTLKMELDARDIGIELLPTGMDRRRVNQSVWDSRTNSALLTIEYKFHAPKSISAPPINIITHGNNFQSTLIDLLRAHIPPPGDSKGKWKRPEWMRELVHASLEDPEGFMPPHCVMTAPRDPMSQRPGKTFYKLDPSEPVFRSLRYTEFTEFPTIEVWEEFQGVVVDHSGAVMHDGAREPPAKRLKFDIRAGKKAIEGLVGGYGSDEDEPGEEDPCQEEKGQSALAVLRSYSGSEDEMEGADSEDDDGPEVPLNEASLLELMKQREARRTWTVFDEDTVDWGDSEEET